MSETEAPLTHDERLAVAALYTNLVMSQNRTPLGQLGFERTCYADHDIHSPTTLSHKEIPATWAREGFETC